MKKKTMIYIYIFDLIFSYKGWRFFKNLPVNGQRTWTNSNTSFFLNRMIKNHKVYFFKTILGISNIDKISSILMLEYYNLLWKLQWYDEWLELKKQRFMQLHNKKYKKEVFISEEFILSELLFVRSRYLKKKVRIQFKSGFNLLGFQPNSLWNYNL